MGRFSRRNALKKLALIILIGVMSSSTQAQETALKELRVLSFNVWSDGKPGGVPQTAEVIRASGAHLVGLQEVHQSGDELAKLTGMTFTKLAKGGVLSRLPVVAKSEGNLGVKVEISPQKYLWIYNVHLHHEPYQPYQLAGIPYGDGNPLISTSVEAVAEAIRARGNEMGQLLMDLAPAMKANEPIVITGDFNEPSHLDWSKEAVQAGKVPMVVSWPQSRLLYDAGFQDAYRQLHSNPVNTPGYTWTPKPSAKDVLDRIDFVYQTRLDPVQAQIVGESAENADIVVKPYPSDHRAVVITFQL